MYILYALFGSYVNLPSENPSFFVTLALLVGFSEPKLAFSLSPSLGGRKISLVGIIIRPDRYRKLGLAEHWKRRGGGREREMQAG